MKVQNLLRPGDAVIIQRTDEVDGKSVRTMIGILVNDGGNAVTLYPDELVCLLLQASQLATEAEISVFDPEMEDGPFPPTPKRGVN